MIPVRVRFHPTFENEHKDQVLFTIDMYKSNIRQHNLIFLRLYLSMIDSIQDRSEGKNAEFRDFGDFDDFLVTLMLGFFVNGFS